MREHGVGCYITKVNPLIPDFLSRTKKKMTWCQPLDIAMHIYSAKEFYSEQWGRQCVAL